MEGWPGPGEEVEWLQNEAHNNSPSFLSSNMALSMDTCRSLGIFVSTLAVFLACFQLTEAGGKTLVLVDNANTKETHSIFFNSLKGRSNPHCSRLGWTIAFHVHYKNFTKSSKLRKLTVSCFQNFNYFYFRLFLCAIHIPFVIMKNWMWR